MRQTRGAVQHKYEWNPSSFRPLTLPLMHTAATAHTISTQQPNSFSESRILLSEIIGDTDHKAHVAQLVGEDAQCIADFLSIVRFNIVVVMLI